jgi:hypothetical protein
MRTILSVFAILATLSTGCQTSSGTKGGGLSAATQIEEGANYPGGTTLGVDVVGLQFRVPAGWSGQIQGEFFVMQEADGEGIIVLGTAELTLAEGEQLARESIDLGEGVVAIPATVPDVSGRTIRVGYDLRGNGLAERAGEPNDWDGVGVISIGDYGIGAVVLGLAPASSLSAVSTVLDSLVVSVRFFEPGSQEAAPAEGSSDWAAELAGYRITYFYSDTDYYESEEYTLCANGDLQRVLDSSAVYSTRNGTWTAYGPAHSGTIEFSLNDGEYAAYELTWDDEGGLYLDGFRYYLEWDGC